jgi:transcriptional regulator of acetoin/glycerol metabolism
MSALRAVASLPFVKQEDRIEAALRRFRHSGELEPNVVRTPIEESWRRCYCAAPQCEGVSVPRAPAARGMNKVQPAAREFTDAARPIMEETREFLSHSGTIMVLADSCAVVLEVQGDETALAAAADMGLTTNVDWSESARGTNAIGTALHAGEPVHVHGPGHYCNGSMPWTFAGTVVRDPGDGSVLGVVSVAGFSDTFNPYLLPLTLAIAGRISSALSGREIQRRERLLEYGLSRIRRSLRVACCCSIAEGASLPRMRAAVF